MAAYACADLHLGHRQIHLHRNFPSVEDHDNFVEYTWRDRVRSNKRDTTYVLGDVAFTKEGWDRFDSFPGKKIVVLGNHCTEYVTAEYIAGLKTVNSVHSLLRWKSMIMSHAPLHPDHLRGKRNLHGHLHNTLVKDRRYLNVSLEHTEMGPRCLHEIEAEFEKRKNIGHVFYSLGSLAAMRAVVQTCKKKLS